MSNDEQEQERLDIHHHLIVLLLGGKLHLAPISSTPHRVLDLGTGTGIWAIDFADEYPSAQVIGNDLSPIQPANVPPNLTFVVDDIEDYWGYEKVPFDYVHARYLAASIRDWPGLVRQAFRNIKPGGWVEFQEWDYEIQCLDNSLTPEHDLWKWHQYTCSRLISAGIDPYPGLKLENYVRDAGFTNVKAHIYAIPLGTWPKDPRYVSHNLAHSAPFPRGSVSRAR